MKPEDFAYLKSMMKVFPAIRCQILEGAPGRGQQEGSVIVYLRAHTPIPNAVTSRREVVGLVRLVTRDLDLFCNISRVNRNRRLIVVNAFHSLPERSPRDKALWDICHALESQAGINSEIPLDQEVESRETPLRSEAPRQLE